MKATSIKVNGKPIRSIPLPMRFNGDLWEIISKRIPELRSSYPYGELIPLAEEILRASMEEWGTPDLEPSSENPAGRRTPGWEAVSDTFNP